MSATCLHLKNANSGRSWCLRVWTCSGIQCNFCWLRNCHSSHLLPQANLCERGLPAGESWVAVLRMCCGWARKGASLSSVEEALPHEQEVKTGELGIYSQRDVALTRLPSWGYLEIRTAQLQPLLEGRYSYQAPRRGSPSRGSKDSLDLNGLVTFQWPSVWSFPTFISTLIFAKTCCYIGSLCRVAR